MLKKVFYPVHFWLNSLPRNGPYNSFVKWFELEEALIPIILLVLPVMFLTGVMKSFLNNEFMIGILFLLTMLVIINLVAFCLCLFRLQKPLSEEQRNFVSKVAFESDLPVFNNSFIKAGLRDYIEAAIEHDKENNLYK